MRPAPLPLRALLAFLALPGVVAFAVPLLIASADASRETLFLPGVIVVVVGIVLLLCCVRDFLVTGKGTLAPWDPPQLLVVTGLYRHVRNPMYVGVLTLVAGWAILFASGPLAVYAVVLAAAFHVRVRTSEEPWLAARFGAAWPDYRAHVRRWWPRRTPWTPPARPSTPDDGPATGTVGPACTIAPALPRDVAALAAIELAAARLLEGHAPASVLAETTDEAELRAAMADGRLFVARDRDVPVGFALVELLSPRRAHLEEVDVLPSHGRSGLGASLVRAVCDWAEQRGCAEVTLTTFRDLPWNLPFYERLGFVEIAGAALDAEMAAIVRDEEARGLARERRVVMCRALRAPSTRVTVYARVGTFDVPPESLDPVVELFRSDAVPLFRTCDGFLGYRAYVDRERGRLIGISLWTTRAALEASTEQARGAIARGAELGARLVGEPQVLAQVFDEPGV